MLVVHYLLMMLATLSAQESEWDFGEISTKSDDEIPVQKNLFDYEVEKINPQRDPHLNGNYWV